MDILVLPLVSVGKFVPLRPFKPVAVGVIVSEQIGKNIKHKDKQNLSKTDQKTKLYAPVICFMWVLQPSQVLPFHRYSNASIYPAYYDPKCRVMGSLVTVL
jgi:surface antigen